MQSVSNFHKLVNSQCDHNEDIEGKHTTSCLPRYTSVIEDDHTFFRLLWLSEENTKTPLLHKPGNCSEKNMEPVVVVDGSEKQWKIAWAKTDIGLPTPSA